MNETALIGIEEERNNRNFSRAWLCLVSSRLASLRDRISRIIQQYAENSLRIADDDPQKWMSFTHYRWSEAAVESTRFSVG